MISKLKNWWFAIVTGVLTILDLGFDVVNPFLADLGVEGKILTVIKVIFGLYAIIKLKKSLPTQNAERLNEMVQSIGGTQIPPQKDEK